MSRSFFLTAFFALALQASQAQMFSHGIPAGATSPEPDGRQHGVPATVMSPTPLPFGVNPPLRSQRNVRVQGPLRRFGTPAHHGRPVFVPVPLFYSYYTDGYPLAADPYVNPETPADPAAGPQQTASADTDSSQQPTNDQALQQAYLQGARDALRDQEGRYGDHYLDSRERSSRSKPVPQPKPVASQPAEEDKSPATVFIFKDGHQLETKNYAIMGQTLFDFSGNSLKKVPLDQIDATATAKVNDDRGVQVKLQ